MLLYNTVSKNFIVEKFKKEAHYNKKTLFRSNKLGDFVCAAKVMHFGRERSCPLTPHWGGPYIKG